jgi:hypothetical protein
MEDYNSIRNQEIKGKFISIHIYACVTNIVEFILKVGPEHHGAPFSIDELNDLSYYEDSKGNTYSEDEKDHTLTHLKDELEAIQEQLEDAPEDKELLSMRDSFEDAIDELESADLQYLDIYEWWIVSPFLARKLEEESQPILTDGFNHYWGRCTTGQAILLDAVISRICSSMEIMDGQKNAWVK